MKRFFTTMLLSALVISAFVAGPVNAAGEKFIFQNHSFNGSAYNLTFTIVDNTGTYYDGLEVPISGASAFASENGFRDAAKTAVVNWAVNNGFTSATAADVLFPKSNSLVKADVGLGNVDNTSDANKPISTATQTALNAKGAGTVTSVVCGTGLSGGTITSSGTCSLPNTGTAGTYAAVTTDAQGRVTAGMNPSFANPSRTLNSAYQISSTRATFVSYAVDIATTLNITGGATGTVFLEYADDSGFTTNVVTVNSTANGNTGTLTIGLTLTQTATGSVSGVIPAGKYVRLRTANTAGTPTFTFRTAQEVLW